MPSQTGSQAVAPGAISLRRPQSDPPARHPPCCWGALTLTLWGSVRSSQGAPAPPTRLFPAVWPRPCQGRSILSCARRGGRPVVTTRDPPWPVEGAELGLGSSESGAPGGLVAPRDHRAAPGRASEPPRLGPDSAPAPPFPGRWWTAAWAPGWEGAAEAVAPGLGRRLGLHLPVAWPRPHPALPSVDPD